MLVPHFSDVGVMLVLSRDLDLTPACRWCIGSVTVLCLVCDTRAAMAWCWHEMAGTQSLRDVGVALVSGLCDQGVVLAEVWSAVE